MAPYIQVHYVAPKVCFNVPFHYSFAESGLGGIKQAGNVEEGVQKTYESSFSNRARNGKGRRVVIAGGLGDVRWRTRRWDRKAR